MLGTPRSAADILALLESERVRSQPARDPDATRRYRHAAAVLVSLKNPSALQPVGGGGRRDEGRQLLASELIPATGRKFDGVQMLHPDSRRSAIAELTTVDARREALRANQTERTGTLQQQFENYLLDVAIPMDQQSAKELEETLQIVSWLDGLLENLPSMKDVRSRLSRLNLLMPFEALAGDGIFRGRRRELDDLRSYIGVLEPAALLRRLADKAFRWTQPDALPALSISGSGGVGKSALVARFMLEHFRLPPGARIPFAYLDFERPTLSISQPGTLLLEMLRQLDLQFAQEGYFQSLNESYVREMGTGERPDSIDNQQLYDNRVRSIITEMADLFEKSLGPRPFVIVLDTFEEVQYRGETSAFPFWELLDQMQRARPFLRVVISGRAPVSSLVLAGGPPKHIEIGELDRDAAIGFLQGQGIQDPKLADALVKQVGGVPLSLKLAASVVKRDGADAGGVKGVSGKSIFWFSTSDEAIQGTLYARILGHLHDPALERLAHPGLVLRRISAPVILNVLNSPCQLGISTTEEATALFEKLRRETSLVASDTLDGSLVHRPDLRRTMLKLLVEKSPAVAAKIHYAAVDWYATQSGWRAKAEELYHRLQLSELVSDQDLQHPEIRSSLQSSIAELPPAAQRFLATLGYQVSQEVLGQATREEREASLAAQVEELLPQGPRSVEHARSIVESALSRDHANRLFCAAARVAAQQQRFSDAAVLLEEGLHLAFTERNPRNALDLLSEQAWLLRRRPDLGDLSASVMALGEHARRYDSLAAILQHRVQVYELDQAALAPKSRLGEIGELIRSLTPYELWAVFPLLEQVVTPLYQDYPKLAATVMRLIADSEGPFKRVEFQQPDTQSALNGLLAGASFVSADPSGDRAILSLCSQWPFRVLGVKPPYASGSYETQAAR